MADYDPDSYEHKQHPMAAAMQWVHRITTVVMEMILPGLFGVWLDKRWGTDFIGLLGFALGMITAITHLLQMTKHETAMKAGKTGGAANSQSSDSQDDSQEVSDN